MATITTIISDLSRTVLFPKDKTYEGSLNGLYKEVKNKEDFNFWNYYELNTHLLDQYKEFKFQGIDIYLFTTGSVQEDPAMNEAMQVFSKSFTVESIGNIEKTNPESYKNICKQLEKDPDTVLFVDDTHENISTARTAGLKTLRYEEGTVIDLERESKDWIGATAIIQNDKGEYLFIVSNKDTGEHSGKYYPPSGTVEEGEAPEVAVVREMEEELNIEVTVAKKIAEIEGDLPGLTLMFFECQIIDSGNLKMDDNELAGYYWFSEAEIKGLNMYPATKRFFREYVNMQIE